MYRFGLHTVLVLSVIVVCAGCGEDNDNIKGIEGISFENYPRVDGSTSARALNVMVACKLLGIRYYWQEPPQTIADMITGEWIVEAKMEYIPQQYREDFFLKRVVTSQTHGAFMNLINGNADIILTHRTISPDEKAHADDIGVTLIESSIALDAFVFIVNKNNPIRSLTVNEIQKIYTKEITNWSQVGGNNVDMDVFTRPRNSGSEEVFRNLVMGGIEPTHFPERYEIADMNIVFKEMYFVPSTICYTFNNYKDMIVRVPDSEVPKIAINNIFPDNKTVKNGTYPFISKVHVAIRSDLDRNSMAYKLYEWLQSEDAKSTIIECGFIPKE